MAIDWQSYNVGAGHKVEYLQPSSSSIALNRVLGGDPSQIRGSLVANGRVFLVNPNGIVFGERSVIDVAGIVASTLNITNEDFMAGKFTFEGTSSNVIVNKGNVVAKQGGFVVLIAAKMENVGRLNAAGGDVLLAAGQRVRLDLGGPVKIEVEGPVVDAYIKNGGIIQADGGNVVLTVNAADQLASLAINNTGVIQARGIGMGDGGTIRLSASGQGAIESSGTIDASSERAKGGQISIDAAKIVLSAGSVTKASGATAGGDIKLTAKVIQIDAQSVVDVRQKVAPALAVEIQVDAKSVVDVSQKVVSSVAVPDATAVASSSLPQSSGGSIRIEADSVELKDARLDASGAEQGGSIVMSGASQNIAGSVLDVSGAVAGGRIRVNAPVDLPEAPRQPQPQGPAPAPTTIVVSNSVLRSDSENGEGGIIELTANELDLRDDNTVSANGAFGGGNIKLGGGYQGKDRKSVV
jgi:filamentous hemagglutinin family protein